MDTLDKDHILAVDLDGTLLRSDILYECFWSACGNSWTAPFSAAFSLASGGKTALKDNLKKQGSIAVETLPYDPDVIEYVENWKQGGGKTALVTASHQNIAADIADHLQIFDEVHGADQKTNLKGTRKAEFLEERFGRHGFTYIGDSNADLPVWKSAKTAVTVNADKSLRKKAEQVSSSIEHLKTTESSLKPYIKALRPHQWMKNVLVFLPVVAAHAFEMQSLIMATLAFLSFSLVASSVYVLNDLLDLTSDRTHPRKCKRPFASGSIPISAGTWMIAGLLVLGGGLALLVGPYFCAVMAGYLLLTTAYSLTLKRKIVVDICTLAALYTIRIIAGGVATGIPLSVWLLAFAIFIFLSLAAVKRQAELVDVISRGKEQVAGRGYSVDDLPIISMIAIAAGYISAVVTVLYVSSEEVVKLYSNPELLWGVSVVLLYWISRAVLLAHRGQMHDDPVVFAVKDRTSQMCFLIILGLAFGGTLWQT